MNLARNFHPLEHSSSSMVEETRRRSTTGHRAWMIFFRQEKGREGEHDRRKKAKTCACGEFGRIGQENDGRVEGAGWIGTRVGQHYSPPSLSPIVSQCFRLPSHFFTHALLLFRIRRELVRLILFSRVRHRRETSPTLLDTTRRDDESN